MNPLLESSFERVCQHSGPLLSWRKKYWAQLEKVGLFQTRQEAFQYLPLSRISWQSPAEMPTSFPSLSQAGDWAGRIVFFDGFFQKELSQIPEGLSCLSLEQALRSYGLFLPHQMQALIEQEKDPMALLNGALHGQGAFLYVPAGTILEKPLQIVLAGFTQQMSSPRLHICLGEGAELSCVQMHEGGGTFSNAFLQIFLEKEASLHFSLEGDGGEGVEWQSVRASLKEQSCLHCELLSRGSALSRYGLQVQLLEPRSEALLQGLSWLKQTRHSHIHTQIEHKAPEAFSRQQFHQVLQGESRASFEGKIQVDSVAQKTESYQLCKSLLLSEQAKSFAKPNLEIFADDVKASHGATVGRLDPEQLFYLQSRGLSRKQAHERLVHSFCRQVPFVSPFLHRRLLEMLGE